MIPPAPPAPPPTYLQALAIEAAIRSLPFSIAGARFVFPQCRPPGLCAAIIETREKHVGVGKVEIDTGRATPAPWPTDPQLAHDLRAMLAEHDETRDARDVDLLFSR